MPESSDIVCPHLDDCCDARTEKCKTCKKNKKRSYYEPDLPYQPQPIITPKWGNPIWMQGDNNTVPCLAEQCADQIRKE